MTHDWLGCSTEALCCYCDDGAGVLFMQVIMALTAACLLLLIRTVFALLAVDQYKYSNQPHLLYSLLVLPELLALYIISVPGFLPAVGLDAESTPGKTLPEDAAAIPVQASSSWIGDQQHVQAWSLPHTEGGAHGYA